MIQTIERKGPKNESSLVPQERRILRDFFLSFKFSQGQGHEIQSKYFFPYLVQYYKQAQDPIILTSGLAVAVSKFKKPAKHSEIGDPSESSKEFHGQWRSFHAAVRDQKDVPPTFFPEVANALIGQDRDYVVKGRYTTADGDKFESFVRTYGLQGKTTGSSAFDTLFSGIKEAIEEVRNGEYHIGTLEHRLQTRLEWLEREWERMHLGQSFIYSSSDPS